MQRTKTGADRDWETVRCKREDNQDRDERRD